jgi:hypothetical protein
MADKSLTLQRAEYEAGLLEDYAAMLVDNWNTDPEAVLYKIVDYEAFIADLRKAASTIRQLAGCQPPDKL